MHSSNTHLSPDDFLDLDEATILIWLVETMEMLKEWADEIIDMRDYLIEDIWRNSRHPDLLKKVEEIWNNYVEKHPLE